MCSRTRRPRRLDGTPASSRRRRSWLTTPVSCTWTERWIRAHMPPPGCRRAYKADGAPDIEFGGYQYFNFPMDHGEFTETGVIGNPFRATSEKGDEALNRFARHLVQAIDAFRPLEFEIKNRAYMDRV